MRRQDGVASHRVKAFIHINFFEAKHLSKNGSDDVFSLAVVCIAFSNKINLGKNGTHGVVRCPDGTTSFERVHVIL
ncbi:hypothetical protein D3C74_440380 [compost metagenome]